MFGTNPRMSSPSVSNGHHPSAYSAPPNRLSSDVSIKGDVTFGSAMLIDCELEGNVTSSGTLTVGSNGKVSGDIDVDSVTIQGLVEGNVVASGRCALEAGGTLQGDVEAPRFAVDENASFVGNAKIKPVRE